MGCLPISAVITMKAKTINIPERIFNNSVIGVSIVTWSDTLQFDESENLFTYLYIHENGSIYALKIYCTYTFLYFRPWCNKGKYY